MAAPQRQASTVTAYTFKNLIDFWAAERKHISRKSVYEVEHIAGKLAKFIGYEEISLEARLSAAQADRLTNDDFIGWKEALIKSGLSSVALDHCFRCVFESARSTCCNGGRISSQPLDELDVTVAVKVAGVQSPSAATCLLIVGCVQRLMQITDEMQKELERQELLEGGLVELPSSAAN